MEINKRLLEADDESGFYCPWEGSSTNPLREMSESITRIRDEIQNQLGLNLEIDGNVQDASFHEELRVLNPASYLSGRVTAIICDLGIRFSNFGRLYTIFSATESLEKYPVDGIKGIVDKEGWFFVDPYELEATYYGKNKRMHGVSWWISYFDYL